MHQFLDQKGIINYQVTSSTIPTGIPSTSSVPRGGESAITNDGKSSNNDNTNMMLPLQKNQYPHPHRRICVVCSNQCGNLRYDNVEDPEKQIWAGELTICEDCFVADKLPMHWTSNQFVLKDDSVSSRLCLMTIVFQSFLVIFYYFFLFLFRLEFRPIVCW